MKNNSTQIYLQDVLPSPSSLSHLKDFKDRIDLICNKYNAIRRYVVYDSFRCGVLSLDAVKDIYCIYRDDPEYICLKTIELEKTIQERIIPLENSDGGLSYDLGVKLSFKYRFFKACKRGNDVYKERVKSRLNILRKLPSVVFFNDDDVDKRTSLLFFTLTYDPNRCDVATAWKNIGKEFHLFLSNLRKQYGDIAHFRTWESTQNYYPHVHVAVLFWDTSFIVLSHKDKDGKIRYRIPYNEKVKISKYWHSHVDIQAIKSSDDVFLELTKYITKDLCSNKGDKTNAMIWLFNKQSYSLSKNFIRWLKNWYLGNDNPFDIEEDNLKEPSFTDLINNMHNCNSVILECEFIGIVRGSDLGISSDVWHFACEKPPPRAWSVIKELMDRRKSLVYGRFGKSGVS